MYIFLGNPLADIKAWIKSHSSTIPPMGAENWIEAINPDGSPYKQYSTAEWVFSDGENYRYSMRVNPQGPYGSRPMMVFSKDDKDYYAGIFNNG